MNRLKNRPLDTSTGEFNGGDSSQVTKQARFDGIGGVDIADFNQTTEAPVNHQLRMRPFYDDVVENENDSDQLYGFLRYDLLFPGHGFEENATTVSNIGTITFTLQGVNRYMHEAKLDEEERIRQAGGRHNLHNLKYYNVKWFVNHFSFHGILNSDKSQPMPWGGMEKTGVVLTQGMTRIPSCFPCTSIPPFTRLAFLVKEVCIKDQKQTYVTNVEKNGKTLYPTSDGHVTRVLPIAHARRYLTNFCDECGIPPQPNRAVYDNCPHKDKMLLYEVTIGEDDPDYHRALFNDYLAKMAENNLPVPTDKPHKYSYFKDKNGVFDLEKLKQEYQAKIPSGIIPKKLIFVRKAHYIPFAMTEQGLGRTVNNPNMYRHNSEINESQYQLNSHEEIWLRAD